MSSLTQSITSFSLCRCMLKNSSFHAHITDISSLIKGIMAGGAGEQQPVLNFSMSENFHVAVLILNRAAEIND